MTEMPVPLGCDSADITYHCRVMTRSRYERAGQNGQLARDDSRLETKTSDDETNSFSDTPPKRRRAKRPGDLLQQKPPSLIGKFAKEIGQLII